MTTIVYAHGHIACDSKVSCGGILIDEKPKVMEFGPENKGMWFAFAGNLPTVLKIWAHLDKKGLDEIENLNLKCDNFECLIWGGKELYYLDQELHPEQLDKDKSYCLGTGRELAMGALEVLEWTQEPGQETSNFAFIACKVAAKLDNNSGGKIYVRKR